MNPNSIEDRIVLANLAIARNAPREFSAEFNEACLLQCQCLYPENPGSEENYYKQCALELKSIIEKRLRTNHFERPFHFLCNLEVYQNGKILRTNPPGSYGRPDEKIKNTLLDHIVADWSLYRNDKCKNFELKIIHSEQYDDVTVTPQTAAETDLTCSENDDDATDSNSLADADDNTDPGKTVEERSIRLNNEGVTLLNQNRYAEAFEVFKACLRLNTSNELHRSNYSIALNNYGLSMQKRPEIALQLFEKALFLDMENITTQHNADGILRMMNLNPKSIFTRLDLGSKALARNDLEAAVVEFLIASRLTPPKPAEEPVLSDPWTMNNKAVDCLNRDDLEQAINILNKAFANNLDYPLIAQNLRIAMTRKALLLYQKGQKEDALKVYRKMSELKLSDDFAYRKMISLKKELNQKFESDNYSEYMTIIQKRIKKFWRPVTAEKSYRVVLSFDVSPNGKVSKIKVEKPTVDTQSVPAIEAIKNASPFPELSKKVSIQFTFDYNVHDNRKKISTEQKRSGLTINYKWSVAKQKEVDKYQSLLAEKLLSDQNSAELINLRLRLVRAMFENGQDELAEYLLEDACAAHPQNTLLEEELRKHKKPR
ncbi:MAG: TonB C-terminal domain-containing protein [Cyanobacteria bacterium TGS_CYA1]|nr:TonB C-terminal domain-containing protein [Cyanobacteria bacterium TGS_CYA1]